MCLPEAVCSGSWRLRKCVIGEETSLEGGQKLVLDRPYRPSAALPRCRISRRCYAHGVAVFVMPFSILEESEARPRPSPRTGPNRRRDLRLFQGSSMFSSACKTGKRLVGGVPARGEGGDILSELRPAPERVRAGLAWSTERMKFLYGVAHIVDAEARFPHRI